MKKPRITLTLTMALLLLLATAVSAFAKSANAKPTFGMLYYEGDTVRTIVTPSSSPHEGRDPLFMVTNGAEGQLGIAGVAPGDRDYHGGQWAVYKVTWNDGFTPELLTSAQEVHDAATAGEVTVVRDAVADFKCPIQP